MITGLQEILGTDVGTDLKEKLNANFDAIEASFGMEQVLSVSVTIPTNRSVVTSGVVAVPGALVLTIAGTAVLHIIG